MLVVWTTIRKTSTFLHNSNDSGYLPFYASNPGLFDDLLSLPVVTNGRGLYYRYHSLRVKVYHRSQKMSAHLVSPREQSFKHLASFRMLPRD